MGMSTEHASKLRGVYGPTPLLTRESTPLVTSFLQMSKDPTSPSESIESMSSTQPSNVQDKETHGSVAKATSIQRHVTQVTDPSLRTNGQPTAQSSAKGLTHDGRAGKLAKVDEDTTNE